MLPVTFRSLLFPHAQIAESCPRLKALLAEQHADAEAKVEAHWCEVQRKREDMAELREQLRELDAKIPMLEAQLREAQVCACVRIYT